MSLSENSKNTVNLAKLTSDVELLVDEFELTGKIAGNYTIIIPDGATVTLNKAKTNGIVCKGDCTIILAENTRNTVLGTRCDCPGIFVPEGKTLTIDGPGSLNVSSENAAGIGAGCGTGCGNVVIKNGTIKAVGGQGGAGIGGAYVISNEKVTYGDVIIYGGTVSVKGGYLAAGIGTGANYNSDVSFGFISINGGVVEAKAGLGGAGIGTGPVGVDSCKPCKSLMKSITISGGSVNAKGAGPAAGIGTGWLDHKDCSTSVESITITDDVIEVTATRGKTPPGRCCIGVGDRNSRGTSTVGSITIGGKVTEGIEKSSFTYKPKKTNH
jgi:hypothetical protein